jgi:hypothetical protein
MGLLTEPGLETLVAKGCAACGGTRLTFRAYLDGRLSLLGGEPIGSLTWIYDGEKFVDGVFEVRCTACGAQVFSATVCPRCHVEDGLALALAGKNRFQAPAACPSCDGEEVRLTAMVPAQVAYEGRRALKPRTSVEFYDPGFHGVNVDCRDCGPIAELLESGAIRPVIDRTFPFAEAREALAYVESGRAVGKVVVTVP